ncbi:hypothetical protein [Glycomyces paridis]|uniref:Uncharacterized protein n=1 Tax=Glycomyces paridis TaxID=2126555 RepID=A0A4V4HN27_9ACTN|nr:hypothetical protein [Glycomyces paridis]THV24356.1 hypothetical protein E9998_21255 [Glycomyces paridis]
MTYPPQDPGPSGGPAYPGADPYGQSQAGAQPPAGGYAPGQVGPDLQYPTSQLPGGYGQYQPDPNAPYQSQPAYQPQPGYQQGYDPYGQYGPPPVQPRTGGSGTTILVIVVVLLMAVGGVAGYFLLGGEKDEGSLGAGEDATTQTTAPEDDEDGGESGEEEEAPAPSGEGLTVASLGAVTPLPSEEWLPYAGPGTSDGLLLDAHISIIQHTDVWISYFGVGVFSSLEAPYDPADLNATAEGAAAYWLDGAFGSVTDYQQGEITYTEVEVDGRPGVLAEWRNSWAESSSTPDLYEDTAILVVDVDGVNGFIGVASVSESATDEYAPAVDAILATVFDAESA